MRKELVIFMISKEYFSVCDFCGKRVPLKECYSISTKTFSYIRNKLHWIVKRNGKFVCNECRGDYND